MKRPTLYATTHGFSKLIWYYKLIRYMRGQGSLYIKQIKHIESTDHAYKFILNTHFVMQFLKALDISPSLPPFLL